MCGKKKNYFNVLDMSMTSLYEYIWGHFEMKKMEMKKVEVGKEKEKKKKIK